MSQDENDNEKNFLARWSQRKQEAKQSDAESAAIRPDEEPKASSVQEIESLDGEQFDLSSLPKLEEITETTDITGFLRKGVPESLRNAALRKSWALDPAIRNYVNPALDYAYDWNTPGGVPGTSELAIGTDVANMVRQIMGGELAAESSQGSGAPPPGGVVDDGADNANVDASQNSPSDLELLSVRLSIPPAVLPADGEPPEPAENPQQEEYESAASQQKVRRHGTAKSRV